MKYAKNIIRIGNSTISSLWVAYNFGKNGEGSGGTDIPEGKDFYGIPYDVLAKNIGRKIDLEKFRDEYDEINQLINSVNYFPINYPPCSLMSEQEINQYISYLEAEKIRENYYTKQTVQDINNEINQTKTFIQKKLFLSKDDLKTRIVHKPKIDRYRDIFLSLVTKPSFSRGIRIHLTRPFLSGKNHYIICQKGDFHNEKFGYKDFSKEWIIKISPAVFYRIEKYLENNQISLLPDEFAMMDGETRSIQIGEDLSDIYTFSWSLNTRKTEPLHRLSEFLINLANKNYPQKIKDKDSEFDEDIFDFMDD